MGHLLEKELHMPVKDLNADSAPQFVARINAIRADTQREWGTMTPAEMCKHMTLSIEGGLGNVAFKDRSNPLIRLALPIVFSGLIPMPKGRAKTAPEYVATDADAFDEERDRLLDAISRFLEWCEENPDASARHPLFGMLTVAQWQRGHGLHLEHHLQQFGV
jgi:hypothetical protein